MGENAKSPYWTEGAELGSLWGGFLESLNIGSWMKNIMYGMGFHHPNTGTFSRNTWANQDPIFYPHHAFTVLLDDFGLNNLVKKGKASLPLYDLDKVIEERGVKECPGNNPTDVTVFKNLVRYSEGQDIGSEQSWDHILDMWSEEKRDYEWVINDDFITNFDEVLRYDDSCSEGCQDEALLIRRLYANTNLTFEGMCQQFVADAQASSGQSNEEVCGMRLREIPSLGAPFLPYNKDLRGHSCKKTCNYCKTTCGDPQED